MRIWVKRHDDTRLVARRFPVLALAGQCRAGLSRVHGAAAESPVGGGRDHHPRCFTGWMAGGGFKPGVSYGETDEFGYNVVDSPVHVHDLQATVLHTLGIDHEKLTFKYQGRRYRLTDVHGTVVRPLLG